jgi:hypothetical protein
LKLKLLIVEMFMSVNIWGLTALNNLGSLVSGDENGAANELTEYAAGGQIR